MSFRSLFALTVVVLGLVSIASASPASEKRIRALQEAGYANISTKLVGKNSDGTLTPAAEGFYLYMPNLVSVECGDSALELNDILEAGMASLISISLDDYPQGYPDPFFTNANYPDINQQCGDYDDLIGEPTLDVEGQNWYTWATEDPDADPGLWRTISAKYFEDGDDYYLQYCGVVWHSNPNDNSLTACTENLS